MRHRRPRRGGDRGSLTIELGIVLLVLAMLVPIAAQTIQAASKQLADSPPPVAEGAADMWASTVNRMRRLDSCIDPAGADSPLACSRRLSDRTGTAPFHAFVATDRFCVMTSPLAGTASRQIECWQTKPGGRLTVTNHPNTNPLKDRDFDPFDGNLPAATEERLAADGIYAASVECFTPRAAPAATTTTVAGTTPPLAVHGCAASSAPDGFTDDPTDALAAVLLRLCVAPADAQGRLLAVDAAAARGLDPLPVEIWGWPGSSRSAQSGSSANTASALDVCPAAP